MTNPEEIRKLAKLRLSEAEILYANGMCDGALLGTKTSVINPVGI